LRSISSRARITATSFTNHYEWGDLKGDPRKFMEQWFDLHLYFTNWGGARRLMIKLPARRLDRGALARFLPEVDWVKVWASGDDLVVDIFLDESEAQEDWDDGSGWLAAVAPLREDLLSGDLRMFYLLWLTAVRDQLVADDEVEPLPGLGPLSAPLEALAEFFGMAPDLVQAAAERDEDIPAMSKDGLREVLAAIPERQKTELLLRVVEGDAHVGAELRSGAREKCPVSTTRRTAGELRIRAGEIAGARDRAAAERRATERRRQAEQAARERRARLAALRQRGASIWREIEDEIERRNAQGYGRALGLLSDLYALAAEEGSRSDFDRRLAAIRVRHAKKGRFIERLTGIGREDGDVATETGES
jgi:hypothetical protein